jgi:hypothetical protein
MAPDKSITFMMLYRHFLVVVGYRILHSHFKRANTKSVLSAPR